MVTCKYERNIFTWCIKNATNVFDHVSNPCRENYFQIKALLQKKKLIRNSQVFGINFDYNVSFHRIVLIFNRWRQKGSCKLSLDILQIFWLFQDSLV